MNHHMSRSGVGAGPAHPRGAILALPIAAIGDEFAAFLRGEVGRLATFAHLPARASQPIRDIKSEGRVGQRLDTAGRALGICASAPQFPVTELEVTGVRFTTWLLSLVPSTPICLVRTWEDETQAQALGDVVMPAALRALELRDATAIDRAIEPIARHAASSQRLLSALWMVKRQLRAAA